MPASTMIPATAATLLAFAVPLVMSEEQTVTINGREVRVQVQVPDPNEPTPEQTMFGDGPSRPPGSQPAASAQPGAAPSAPNQPGAGQAASGAPGAGSAGGSASAGRSSGGGGSLAAPPVMAPQSPSRTPPFTSFGAIASGGMADARGLPATSAGSSAPARPEKPLAASVIALDVALMPSDTSRDLFAVVLTKPDRLLALVVGGVQESGGVEAIGAPVEAVLAAPVAAVAVTWPRQSKRPLAVTASAEGAVSLMPGALVAATPGAAWEKPTATPLALPGIQALAAAQGDIDGDGADDLLIAGLARSGTALTLSCAVGTKLDDSLRPGRWSAWMPVVQELPAGVATIAADIAQTTLNPKPEFLIHLLGVDAGQTHLRTLVGINAEPTGAVEGWIARDQSLGTATDRVAGLGSAAWTDASGGTDVALFWAEQADAGAYAALAVLNNLALAPPYKPLPQDLQTTGDQATGLSVAAVKAQQIAGINSPFQLRARVDPLIEQLRQKHGLKAGERPPKADVLPLIATALDQVQPRLPEAVRPELTRLLLTTYGFDAEVGL